LDSKVVVFALDRLLVETTKKYLFSDTKADVGHIKLNKSKRRKKKAKMQKKRRKVDDEEKEKEELEKRRKY
jgi:hypothetical protein